MSIILANSSWRYRRDIDGLRALAVAIVILFHFEFGWLPGGFVGVDVFFVISGFLITSLIARQIAEQRFSLIDFYERRFRRIYPNLLIVLAVTAVLGFVAMLPLTYRPFGRSLIWAALSGSNFVFIDGKGYFDPGNLSKPLLHTWSLSVEEQFYLVFPWLLILAAKRGYNAVWLIGGVAALSLALSVAVAALDWRAGYFLLPTRFWELGIGALIAILPENDRLSAPQRSVLGIGGLAAVAWAALRLSESDPFPGYLALAPTLGAAAIIWAHGGLAANILCFRPFVWIGRLSFSLYLWHWPLISIAAGIGLQPTDTTTRIVISALTLALSVAGYFLWEQPIRQRRLLPRRKTFFAVLAVFTLAIASLGVLIFVTRGLPQRQSTEERKAIEEANTNSFLIERRCPKLSAFEPASCPIGDETAKDVSFVIVGDSHSTAVAAEIGDVAKRYHLRGLFLGKSACEFLKDTTLQDRTYCFAQYDYAMDKIREHDPKLVILVSRWAMYVGAPPPAGETQAVYRKGILVPEEERRRAVAAAFEDTLSELGPRHVVTALTTPEYNYSIPTQLFLERRLWKTLFEREYFDTTLEQYQHRQTYVEDLLKRAQAAHPNLTVIDPSPVFCGTGNCLKELSGELLYRDTDHLTHAGALLYADLFTPVLEELAMEMASTE